MHGLWWVSPGCGRLWRHALTAEQIVIRLADELGPADLGAPRDDTDVCSNEAASGEPHESDCSQLITTDLVSLYEFRTPELALEWTSRYSRFHAEDWRPVGRFALVWTAGHQGDEVGEEGA